MLCAGNAIKGIDPGNMGKFSGNGCDSLVETGIRNHDPAYLGMLQNISVILVGDRRIQGDVHAAHLQHAQIQKIPFGSVVGYGGDTVTGLQAYGQQSQGNLVNFIQRLRR